MRFNFPTFSPLLVGCQSGFSTLGVKKKSFWFNFFPHIAVGFNSIWKPWSNICSWNPVEVIHLKLLLNPNFLTRKPFITMWVQKNTWPQLMSQNCRLQNVIERAPYWYINSILELPQLTYATWFAVTIHLMFAPI